MLDFISIFSIAVLTVASLVYTRGCDKLKGGRE